MEKYLFLLQCLKVRSFHVPAIPLMITVRTIVIYSHYCPQRL
jgi:hypothetical protein